MTVPDLPSSAIALLHESNTTLPSRGFNLNPVKEGGQLSTPMVSFSIVLFAKPILKLLFALIMSSSHSPTTTIMNYNPHSHRTSLPLHQSKPMMFLCNDIVVSVSIVNLNFKKFVPKYYYISKMVFVGTELTCYFTCLLLLAGGRSAC